MPEGLGQALERARKEQRLEQLRARYADISQPMSDEELDELEELLETLGWGVVTIESMEV